MKRRISVRNETWRCHEPFRIANLTADDFPLVVCEIEQAGTVGRGEALGIYYFDETPASMADQIRGIEDELGVGADRNQLLELLPFGGARFAVDAALWDLEAQLRGTSVWEAIGVNETPVETMFTIGLEAEPEEMAAKAAAAQDYSLLKIKLDADRPVERITAIREARPNSRLVVDVNQGWSFEQLRAFAPELRALDVLTIEQPLPRGEDAELEDYESPVTLCADESCVHLGELETAASRYPMINIKLDKTGGLTHALELAHAARNRGVRIMAGSMGGTSLSMAPTHVLAKLGEFADIDGPLLIGDDRPGGLLYDGGLVSLPGRAFWGQPR